MLLLQDKHCQVMEACEEVLFFSQYKKKSAGQGGKRDAAFHGMSGGVKSKRAGQERAMGSPESGCSKRSATAAS